MFDKVRGPLKLLKLLHLLPQQRAQPHFLLGCTDRQILSFLWLLVRSPPPWTELDSDFKGPQRTYSQY